MLRYAVWVWLHTSVLVLARRRLVLFEQTVLVLLLFFFWILPSKGSSQSPKEWRILALAGRLVLFLFDVESVTHIAFLFIPYKVQRFFCLFPSSLPSYDPCVIDIHSHFRACAPYSSSFLNSEIEFIVVKEFFIFLSLITRFLTSWGSKLCFF